jgi:hypothetical protein
MAKEGQPAKRFRNQHQVGRAATLLHESAEPLTVWQRNWQAGLRW